jgi:hypothetical protein
MRSAVTKSGEAVRQWFWLHPAWSHRSVVCGTPGPPVLKTNVPGVTEVTLLTLSLPREQPNPLVLPHVTYVDTWLRFEDTVRVPWWAFVTLSRSIVDDVDAAT